MKKIYSDKFILLIYKTTKSEYNIYQFHVENAHINQSLPVLNMKLRNSNNFQLEHTKFQLIHPKLSDEDAQATELSSYSIRNLSIFSRHKEIRHVQQPESPSLLTRDIQLLTNILNFGK